MKNYAIIAVLALGAAMLSPAVTAEAQQMGGPGPVIAGSVAKTRLPSDAVTFLDKNYPGVAMTRCEKEYMSSQYDVKLANGVDIEFDAKGKVIDIEAPGNGVLDREVVEAVLPDKTVDHLKSINMLSAVNEIERTGKHYKVGVVNVNPDEIIYTISGSFVEYDD